MKKIIPLMLISLFVVSFVSALNVDISSPDEREVFSSADEDILVKASVETESTCDVWGWIDTPNGRKDINPRECDICSKGSGGTYANFVSAYIDAVPGGDYEIHVTCRDRDNQMDSKIVNFEVEGDMSTDTSPPIITINFPTQGGNHYSNINLDFDVNELSSCRYSVSPQDYNGGSGIGFSGYLNGKTYETSLKQSTQYSLTVICTDLMGNSASKTVSFSTKDRACASCSAPSGSVPSGSGGGGGGQGGGCFDTDGGKDIFVKGISAGVYDSCISKYEISERYCTENNVGANYIGDCPSGYICSEGACIESDEDDREVEGETPTTTYFKSCSYIWDSSPYINQKIKITASIKDSTGNTDSDSVQVEVVEGNIGGGGSGHSMDGKTLDIRINEPRSEQVKAGAVEIKISSKGPNELGEMSLSFSGENWGAGFPISNRNCVAGGSGGGALVGGSTCEKYHTCKDGTEVQYCEIIKQYDSNGNVVGAGCACKQNPEELCTSPSSGGGGGGSTSKPVEIPPSGGGGGSSAETPIICSGCILGDKCVPIGYRSGNKYCTIESELIEQKTDEASCSNAYECESNICEKNQCGKYCDGCKDENKNCISFGTRLQNNKYCDMDKSIKDQITKESTCNNSYECVSNLCVNSKCIEPSFIQKIMDWFKRLFGG